MGRPFYLQLSQYPDQERKEGGGPDRAEARAEAAEIDRNVSRLLDALDRLGIAGSTYVFYTADHGAQGRVGNAPLSGGKGAVTEGGLRVPFLARGPGIPAGICSRVPVTVCDLLPTLIGLAGIATPVPVGVEGGSLVPVLRDPLGRGAVRRRREELVFHFPHYDLNNGGPATAILVGSHKLVRNYERDSIRLYDLETDPTETHDLSATQPDRTKDLDTRLTAYLREVSAQMAAPNPDFDPNATTPIEPEGRRGGQRGRNGRNRK
jgi:arylsulfatase A-like enzyme